MSNTCVDKHLPFSIIVKSRDLRVFFNWKTYMNSLFSYLRNVRAEMAHVVWPTPRKAIMDVIAVVLISAITALIIAGLDYAFTSAVNYIVSHQQG